MEVKNTRQIMSQIDIMQDIPRANSSIWFTLCLDGDYKGYPVRKL